MARIKTYKGQKVRRLSDIQSNSNSTLPIPQSAPSSTPRSTFDYYDDDDITDIDFLLDCLEYSSSRRTADLPYEITTMFTCSTSSPTIAILRRAYAAGLADQIMASPERERYSVGVRPVAKRFQEGVDAQWFAGKSRAEVAAGPWASEEEVKETEKMINQKEIEMNKETGWYAERRRQIEEKLEEGLRRQQAREA